MCVSGADKPFQSAEEDSKQQLKKADISIQFINLGLIKRTAKINQRLATGSRWSFWLRKTIDATWSMFSPIGKLVFWSSM